MLLIEPCCTPKHLLMLRSKMGDNGTAFWHGYGDLSVAELLPAMLTRYSETELLFAAPSLPDVATDVLLRMMDKKWSSLNGDRKLNAIAHLTLITDMRPTKSPAASRLLTENPYGDRLTIRNAQQKDTIIILPDIAFFGNINLTYGGHFTALATKNSRLIEDMRRNLFRL